MPRYQITYDLLDSYHAEIEAADEAEALAKFHAGDYDSSFDKSFWTEMQDTVEIEEI
jgi:hypothetical protein